MKNIKIAIFGYGNLGKAVENLIKLHKNMQIIGIFTNQNKFLQANSKIFYNKDKIFSFINKVDIVIVCSGSQKDAINDTKQLLKHFNVINTFDNHPLILKTYNELNKVAKENKTFCIMSTGWDPGLFSIIKTYMYSISNTLPVCFWGKGISLGHSNAARNINGVKDAIAFTIPNKKLLKTAKKSSLLIKNKHIRKVYIVTNKNINSKFIKTNIKNIENYFKNQTTKIKIVNEKKLNKLRNLKHKGNIYNSFSVDNLKFSMSFHTNMESNPHFTALIILSFVKSIFKLKEKYKYGTFTSLHFSPIDLSPLTQEETIKKFC